MQKNLKRMLAYSSLEHVGLICAAVGMNAPLTVFGAMLHMGCHALTKPVLFFCGGATSISNITPWSSAASAPGWFHTMPATALSARPGGGGRCAALPPFGLFVSEFDGDCRRLHLATILGQRRDPGLPDRRLLRPAQQTLRHMLLGPAPVGAPRRAISASNVAAMSLPLGALLL